MPEQPPDAWVKLPSQEQMRALIPPNSKFPYDFGFLPAMMRLIMAHERIGPAFGTLFAQIMFSPEGTLDRREREMVAAVASAAQDCHY
jgi:alkylhydroperoxidase family enzyme